MLSKQERGLAYVLGSLDGLVGSVHVDVEHYKEVAERCAHILRQVFPPELPQSPAQQPTGPEKTSGREAGKEKKTESP